MKGTLSLTAQCVLVEQHTVRLFYFSPRVQVCGDSQAERSTFVQGLPGFNLEVPGSGVLRARGDAESIAHWVRAFQHALSQLRSTNVSSADVAPVNDTGILRAWSAPGKPTSVSGMALSSDDDSSGLDEGPAQSVKSSGLPCAVSVRAADPEPSEEKVTFKPSVPAVLEKAKAAAERRRRSVPGFSRSPDASRRTTVEAGPLEVMQGPPPRPPTALKPAVQV